jgi:hypothetical protein
MPDLTDLFELPAERELPPGALARRRAELVRAVDGDRDRSRVWGRVRTWLVTLGILAAIGSAAGSAGAQVRPPSGEVLTVAAVAAAVPLAAAAATGRLAVRL